MALSKEEILKLANLAKLELSTAELNQYQHQLTEVLNYFSKLTELNLVTIEASLSGADNLEYQPRADQVQPSTPEVIKQAVELKDNYLVAPAVFKK